MNKPFHKKMDKPWGHEIIYTPDNLPYTGKALFIAAGKRLSIHFHEQKLETLCLFSGQAIIWLPDENGELKKIPMELYHGYTVSPQQKHRIEAISDSYILECSLPETGTTVRVEDDYARPDETEEVRKQDNRGWENKSPND